MSYCQCFMKIYFEWWLSESKFIWQASEHIHQKSRLMKNLGRIYKYERKHGQRHNGPEVWILIESLYTNLDQISSLESRPSINFKISTEHQPLCKTCSNLASESGPRFNFITSTKHQQKKTGQTPASHLAWTSKSAIVANTILFSNSYNINKFWVGIFTRQGYIN